MSNVYAMIFGPLKRISAFGLVVALFAVAGPGVPSIGASSTQACDNPTRKTMLYAVELPPYEGEIRIGWGLTPESASIPGPLLEMYEGECMAITVVNDISEATLAELRDRYQPDDPDVPELPLGVSLHVHGVKYTQASDGTIQTDSWVPPGEQRTYYWYASPRVSVAGRVVDQGTAGYWWYHDHVIGTDHGTGGIGHGLVGGLVVRRHGDVRPDRSYTVVMGPNATINYARWPEVDQFVATEGERVEFLVIGSGDEFHTFHLHGHSWVDNRTGLYTGLADETPLIDIKDVGPAETFGFQVTAGEHVGPGTWMLHCHVQIHSDLGMFSFFNVQPRNGLGPSVPRVVSPDDHVHYGRG